MGCGPVVTSEEEGVFDIKQLTELEEDLSKPSRLRVGQSISDQV